MKMYYIIAVVAIALILIVRYFYFKPNVIHGDKAPDFSFVDLQGNTKTLSHFRGQVVLLDFWGSWCPPCRKENPDLLKIYDRYGATGQFAIISVGIETNKEAWAQAIEKDQLSWNNHFTEHQRFDSEVAKLYGIKSIPSKFIIDKKGNIVSVNPSLEQINQYLSEKIGPN